MESPQFPTAPAATTAAPPASPAPAKPAPPRLPALFGVIGGALAIAGFFLPWSATVNLSPEGRPLGYVSSSGWDIVNRLLNPQPIGAGVGGPVPSVSYSPAYFYAVLVAAPAILALVALIVASLSFFRAHNAVMVGLYTAAGALGAFGALNAYPTFVLTLGTTITAVVPSGASTAGLGLVVLYLGYFGIVAGGFMALAKARHS